MSFQILHKQVLGQDIKRLDIKAEEISLCARPGQFVMVAPHEDSSWIPLSIAETDTRRGLISVIFQERDRPSMALGAMSINQAVFSITGPFGKVAAPRQLGVVACVATGVGAAQILSVARAYKREGNKVIGILAGRYKKEIVFETQMRIACHALYISTEDGSYQRRGTAFEAVKEVCAQERVQLVYTIGSVRMMREVAGLTKGLGIRNLMQVQTIMSCGRGMCGSCRVKVDGAVALSCIEGPEFDAHTMDFDYLQRRMDHAALLSREGQGVAAPGGWVKKFLCEAE